VLKYNFFELLTFAVEKFADQSFAEFLQENPTLQTDYQAYLQDQKTQVFTINELMLDKFVSSKSKQERELLKALNLQELINEQVRQELAGYQFKSAESYEPVAN